MKIMFPMIADVEEYRRAVEVVELEKQHLLKRGHRLPEPLKLGAMIEIPSLLWQLDLYSRLQRHYPKPKPYATEAAMDGKWKLLCRDAQPLELFDLEADLAETTNLLERHPEVAERLARDVRAFLDAPRDASGITKKGQAGK